ncbi:hypothetical protein NE237_012130 [Protea cynaroides]|uniref:Bifunctional inhibitor/plant lipid transfer protein/seed storage helical domain-containing protein n=1 Tax=Protea cynaroides TaxID=273540 RepID=A0A9Q0H0G6_9MAGN|nr:hypothetical protein NE237_012130 [Protea cynaroides]
MGSWGKMKMKNQAMVIMATVMLARIATLVQGQSGNTTSCAAALTQCANYLNSTNPPASCCEPLHQTVSTQLKCLCNLLNDLSLLQSLGINITQAEQLPLHCGMPNSTIASCRQRQCKCTTYHTFLPSSPPPSNTSSTPPPEPCLFFLIFFIIFS